MDTPSGNQVLVTIDPPINTVVEPIGNRDKPRKTRRRNYGKSHAKIVTLLDWTEKAPWIEDNHENDDDYVDNDNDGDYSEDDDDTHT